MKNADQSKNGVLLLVAGAKGAIGSTLAAALQVLQKTPELVTPYLTTADKFPDLGGPGQMEMAGWDRASVSFPEALEHCGVLEKGIWEPYAEELENIEIKAPPDAGLDFKSQVACLRADMAAFAARYADREPVVINLLPAGASHDLDQYATLEAMYEHVGDVPLPDIAYAAAAVEAGIAVVNFTPNHIEIPAVLDAANQHGVPVCGKDGKTGQTYLKVVLASALRARNLHVNGWYSLNILGNADGENLMDPDHSACKLDNKTGVLEDVLGYAPGAARWGKSAHQVRIDYYPPRGDAKEAWDVIDFEGIFGLPMSLRVNLQGRDSILAAPMVMDLARWMAALRLAGRAGAVPELAFYFKKPAGPGAPAGFADQVAALERLEKICAAH
ncbi:MAG: inositol-3-phosphate synthase [Desulfobacteraceae bacterium]|nr:inositol-3-phosphate synthase [Desulfobacteraceae bacterium]